MVIGLDIIRAYELSWLDANGKPQIACIELCWQANDMIAVLDTQSLKSRLNVLNRQKYVDKEEFVNDVLNLLPIIPERHRFISSAQFLDQDLTLRSTALNSLIDHNVRFICQRSGQPYTGSVLADAQDQSVLEKIKIKLLKFRNREFSPCVYTEELLEPDCVLSVHLARKGGLSWQIIRSMDRQFNLWDYVQRAGVE